MPSCSQVVVTIFVVLTVCPILQQYVQVEGVFRVQMVNTPGRFGKALSSS